MIPVKVNHIARQLSKYKTWWRSRENAPHKGGMFIIYDYDKEVTRLELHTHPQHTHSHTFSQSKFVLPLFIIEKSENQGPP